MTRQTDERLLQVPLGPQQHLEAALALPPDAGGLVIFAHGSGSSRHSRRNQAVAESLNRRGLATLLIDLLTASEERVDRVTSHLRFDIPLLAQRLAIVTDYASRLPETRGLPVGYFGASTGAAAALLAAAQRAGAVAAVVSRGGRPDLAADALPQVQAPTLLIVGELDETVIELNRKAYELLQVPKRLDIVPKAAHLFEEPGAMDEVARLAGEWFVEHLRPVPAQLRA